MNSKLPTHYKLKQEVADAIKNNQAVVALESAVITHGLPEPENYKLAQDMESVVRENGAVPATIALMDGKIMVGLDKEALTNLSNTSLENRKVSIRDFGITLSKKINGGTTVAATLFASNEVGIRVFATGGIGGVHRGSGFDVSTDLQELSRKPVIVVCAGAKSILDLPATLEVLETMGVPVIGYKTDQYPAFFARESGLKVSYAADSPEEIAEIAKYQWDLGIKSAILVANPPPAETALSHEVIDGVIEKALAEAEALNISGAATTPFLLSKVNEISGGKSMEANLSLLKNNARLAAQIACALSKKYQPDLI
jgi:pseudouridine-5'-phosphate glycosidase